MAHGRRSPVSQPVREGSNGAQWKRGSDGMTAPPIDYWNMSLVQFYVWLQYRYGCKCVTRPHFVHVFVSHVVW